MGAGVEAIVLGVAAGAAVLTAGAATGAGVTGALGVTGSGAGVDAAAVEDVAVACEELRRCGFARGLDAACVRACVVTEVVAGARPEVTDNGSPASPTPVAAS